MSYLIAFNYSIFGELAAAPQGISIFNPVDNKTQRLFDIVPPSGSLGRPTWSPDGEILYFSSYDWGADSKMGCGIYSFELKTKKLKYLWGHRDYNVYEIRLSPDGEFVACSGNLGGLMRTIVLQFQEEKLVETNLFDFSGFSSYINPLWKDNEHLFIHYSNDFANQSPPTRETGYRLYDIKTREPLEKNIDWVYTDSPKGGYRVGFKNGSTHEFILLKLEAQQEGAARLIKIENTIYPYEDSVGYSLGKSFPSFSPCETYVAYCRYFTDGKEQSQFYIYDVDNDSEDKTMFAPSITHVAWNPNPNAEFDFVTESLTKIGYLSNLKRIFS